MAIKNNKTSTTKRRKKKPAIPITSEDLRTVGEGRLLSVEFFRRHAWLILIAVVVVLGLIGQRYTNQSKRQQIKRLEAELATVKSEQVACKSAYMSLIRENEMRRLLRENHIDLDYQEQPPFVITR